MDELERKFNQFRNAGCGRFVNKGPFKNQLTKKHPKDAGLDVRCVLNSFDEDGIAFQETPIESVVYNEHGEHSVYDVSELIIPAKGRACVHALVEVAVPEDCYGQLASRSSLSLKFGIEVGAGVVDVPYRGLVKVVLFNHGFEPYYVQHGDKIAQLISIKIDQRPYVEVDSLDETDRGSKGFGSSGR